MLRGYNTTECWLRDGASKYGDGVIYKSLPCDLKSDAQSDGTVKFSGWASTDSVDRGDDIVESSAFQSSLGNYMETGKMLFMHDWYSIPVGKITTADIKEHGLWIEGYTLPNRAGKDVAVAIEHETLDALSIGFRPIKTSMNEESGIRTIQDLELFEVSFVNAGMNPEALFTQMKELNLNNLTKERGTYMANVSTMPDAIKKAEELVGKFDSTVGEVNESISTLDQKTTDLNRLIKEVQAQHEALVADRVTASEYKTFTEKIGDDLLSLRKDLDKAANKRVVIDKRDAFLEWQLKHAALMPMMHENGSPYSPVDMKAYSLIQASVKYGDRADGDLLKLFRDLNDTVVLTDSYMRRLNRPGYDIRNLKSYKLMVELADVIDPEFAKAMYSTGTGLGDEWVPTFMSGELFDLIELSAELEMLFPHFQMPTSPYAWPILTSHGTMYRASEAVTNNPDQLTQSNAGTSKVTFAAETFAIAMSTSPELIEDAIVAIVPTLRNDMAYTAAKGYESLMLNGDNASTHMDNGGGTAAWTAGTAPETYEDGFRRFAKDASKEYDAQSTTAGVGDATAAFVAEDLRHLRKQMGALGKDTSKVVFTTGLSGYFSIMSMSQFAQPGTYEAGATWRVGALESIDGCRLIVSSEVMENLNASGVYDSSTTDNTHCLCINTTGFKVGEARGATVEFEKNIKTQQWTYVLTMRKSFQKMTASTQYPVANVYNINS